MLAEMRVCKAILDIEFWLVGWRGVARADLIAASVYDKYSVGPSIRPVCTKCCFTMTNMIQVCSNFR